MCAYDGWACSCNKYTHLDEKSSLIQKREIFYFEV
jgi:hypothetical protein